MKQSAHPLSQIEDISLSIHHSSGILEEVLVYKDLSGVAVLNPSQYQTIKSYDTVQLACIKVPDKEVIFQEYGILPTEVLSPALISRACLELISKKSVKYDSSSFTLFEKNYTLEQGVGENVQPLPQINQDNSNVIIFTETLIGGTTWSKLRLKMKGFDNVNISSSGGSKESDVSLTKETLVNGLYKQHLKQPLIESLDPLAQSLCGYVLHIIVTNVEKTMPITKGFPTIIIGSGTMAINANLDLAIMLDKLCESNMIKKLEKESILDKVHPISTEHVTDLLPRDLSIMIRPSRMFTKKEVMKYKYLKGYNDGFVKEGAGMGAITDLAHHLGFTLEQVYNEAIDIFNKSNKTRKLH